ncbi:chromosomal replication initiator protein DnaA [Aggregatilinea lenta]|uniref:chromosomal replication initiator protein DnaA n=1 Tax=Aggregatilinea lenta TaxID=913108 RepID=UPI000E5C3151|nr:chromosomal replication initiator protein DnaA [Aggregatilinea lenta]
MLSPRDAWHATLGQLELQLNRATFDTWLKGSELLAYEDGSMTVRVRHAYAKDWLEQHLYHLISQTLSSLIGEPVRVSFTVSVPAQPPVERQAGTLFAALPDEDHTATNRPQAKAEVGVASLAASDSSAEVDTADTDAAPRSGASTATRSTASSALKPAPRSNEIAHEHPAPRPSASSTLDTPRVPFNRRYTFGSFVTGPSNLFAQAAAKAVADAPGDAYNPLTLYGGSGLGKTHLLNAIGQACEAAGKRVVMVTAEMFTNDMVASIRSHSMADFRDRYRGADVLLVDDIQFIAGKTGTEEEFYHVFNTLISQNSQIVVACNAHPCHLGTLDERLRSRLSGGLMADVQPPEEAMRLAILKAKAEAQGMPLPDDVAQILAGPDTTNVRELEGLLTQVLARTSLTKEPLNADLAYRVLGKSQSVRQPASKSSQRKGTGLKQVLAAAASFHQLSMDDLLSKSRTKEVVRARQVAMYLAREETEASLPQIGEALGRNHSTILHGYKKIASEIPLDDALRHELSAIRRQLYQ